MLLPPISPSISVIISPWIFLYFLIGIAFQIIVTKLKPNNDDDSYTELLILWPLFIVITAILTIPIAYEASKTKLTFLIYPNGILRGLWFLFRPIKKNPPKI